MKPEIARYLLAKKAFDSLDGHPHALTAPGAKEWEAAQAALAQAEKALLPWARGAVKPDGLAGLQKAPPDHPAVIARVVRHAVRATV